MKKFTKLALALAVSGASVAASAMELGEFNGTKFSVGGYIKAEGVFNNPDNGSSTFDATARQSRINFKVAKEVEGHKVAGFVEGDFYGSNSTGSTYDWRMRHAFISVDNVTVGQTWNGQFFAVAPLDGEMVNFWGLGAGTIAGNGGRVRRDVVLHYVNGGVRLTAQDPVFTDADMPDLVASYTQRFQSGSAYNVALTAREVQNGTDSDVGAGLSLAGKLAVGSGALHASAFTGEGMGVYSGVCQGGMWNPTRDADCDAVGGDLVEQSGFSVAYSHRFSDKLRGTARYGEVNVDDAADTSLEMTNVNLIYTYLPGLDLGIEWRDQSEGTLPQRPEGQQIELMAMYKF